LRIAHFTVLVKDIDAAVNFYVDKLGFVKRMDNVVWINMRWVTVSPKDQLDVQLSFALADEDDKLLAVGKQTPNHIFMFLESDDLQRDYKDMKAKGVNFLTHPEEREWGIDAVFEDLYGNIIDLVERPKLPNAASQSRS
jgi:catechol 2,3-dioxygenase-like lactoylglutathione lyase family enzyme